MHTASSPDEACFISPRIRIHQATNPNAFFVAYIIPMPGKLSVKTATEVDMQEIYDYGVDAFFNLETFAK